LDALRRHDAVDGRYRRLAHRLGHDHSRAFSDNPAPHCFPYSVTAHASGSQTGWVRGLAVDGEVDVVPAPDHLDAASGAR
jgi:hypothetical protein